MKHKPYRLAFYILARITAFLLYPLPLSISAKIGALLGKIAFFIIPKEREKTLTHLRTAFGGEKTEGELKKIALNLYSNLGKNAMEWINFPKIDDAWFDKYVTAEGLEHIDKARKKGKGTIVLASHFGNWEFLGLYLNRIGCGGTMIVRKIYIEQFNNFFEKMRKCSGNEIVYRDESPKKILKALKKNGYIGILADQDVDSVEGVFVDFFGAPAFTPVAPVKFAMKTGAALIPMFLVREDGRFRFIAEKEIDLDTTGDEDRDVLVNTIRWTRVLEKYIRKYPDHWVWMHRRWKTKPKSASSHQMQQIDKISQERFKIPSITLMENAGRTAVSCALLMLKAQKDNKEKKRVAVFCGKGNNGGDGLVISRKLIENNFEVATYMLGDEGTLKNDPATNLDLLKKMSAKIIILKDKDDLADIKNSLSGYDLIVDAIFGTGFKGKPDDLISELINSINNSGIDILSIDVPSGLDATTGRCEGACIRAAETVTFGLPKTGFYKEEGPKYTGKVVVKNIGFPESLLADFDLIQG